MKKIIIVINNLEVGGVQKSLVNLLNEINNIYDITLCVFYLENEKFIEDIPQNIKIMKVNSFYKFLGCSQSQLKKFSFKYFLRGFFALMTKIFGRHLMLSFFDMFQRKISGFDYAISYLHEQSDKTFYGGCNNFVLKKINASFKATYVHCDFSLCGANTLKNKKLYNKFNRIICCSNGCAEKFIECNPNLLEKVSVIRNCNNFKMIKKLSEELNVYSKDYFNIVTVARLSAEKSISKAILAINFLIENGVKVKYHIVGEGKQKNELIKLVDQYKLSNSIFFYGNRVNPYPFIKNADLFLLTSEHEAAPMVFDEAAYLKVPILSTRTLSVNEMILYPGFGMVCGHSQEEINMSLFSLILENKLEIIKVKINNFEFNNDESVLRFKKIFNV